MLKSSVHFVVSVVKNPGAYPPSHSPAENMGRGCLVRTRKRAIPGKSNANLTPRQYSAREILL